MVAGGAARAREGLPGVDLFAGHAGQEEGGQGQTGARGQAGQGQPGTPGGRRGQFFICFNHLLYFSEWYNENYNIAEFFLLTLF